MKKLLAILLLISTSAFAQVIPWQESTVMGSNPDDPKNPIGYFVNSFTPSGPGPGVWTDVDVTQFGIPITATEVLLSGILIITGGSTNQTCDLEVSVRAPGSAWNAANYIGQAVNVGVGTGIRSTMATMAPVVNGKIELQWNRVDSTAAQWPVGCSYGINLSLQAYFR